MHLGAGQGHLQQQMQQMHMSAPYPHVPMGPPAPVVSMGMHTESKSTEPMSKRAGNRSAKLAQVGAPALTGPLASPAVPGASVSAGASSPKSTAIPKNAKQQAAMAQQALAQQQVQQKAMVHLQALQAKDAAAAMMPPAPKQPHQQQPPPLAGRAGQVQQVSLKGPAAASLPNMMAIAAAQQGLVAMTSEPAAPAGTAAAGPAAAAAAALGADPAPAAAAGRTAAPQLGPDGQPLPGVDKLRRRVKLTPEQREQRRAMRLTQRRLRKSAREKERRSLENDMFIELANLVGLPPDLRGKASILEAVIGAIQDGCGDELSAEEMKDNISSIYATFGLDAPSAGDAAPKDKPDGVIKKELRSREDEAETF